MNRPKKIAVTLEVANGVQAMELNDAWQEIVSGQQLALAHFRFRPPELGFSPATAANWPACSPFGTAA